MTRIHFGAKWKVFLTLARLRSAICAIFKVNGNTTTEKEIMTIWVQYLQTGLNIFARLLIWKNQTRETDSLCFFLLFFSVFWSASLLITWQGHRRCLSGLIHGLLAAIFRFVSERAISRGSVHSCGLIVGELCRWSDTATALRWLAVRPFDWDCQQSDKHPHQKLLEKKTHKDKVMKTWP